MGDKLLSYYKFVGDHVGLQGKILLAQETKIPSTQAAMEPDTAETLLRFAKAVERITGKSAPRF